MAFLDATIGAPFVSDVVGVDYSDDTLTLGGVVFDWFGTPASLGAGGKQAMVVHKLPGGARVIDTLGPDDDDIKWNGTFFGNDAYGVTQTLDAMRASGIPYALTFAGQFRLVIIADFKWHLRRVPIWIEYEITCTVYQNPMFGILGGILSTIDTLVGSDLGAAASIGAADNAAAVPEAGAVPSSSIG